MACMLRVAILGEKSCYRDGVVAASVEAVAAIICWPFGGKPADASWGMTVDGHEFLVDCGFVDLAAWNADLKKNQDHLRFS